MSTTPSQPAPKKPWYLRPWVWIVAAFIVTSVIAGPFLDTDSDTPKASPTARASTEAAKQKKADATKTESPEPAPTTDPATTAPAKTKKADAEESEAAKAKTKTEAPSSTAPATKAESKEDLVLTWWGEGHGSAVQKYAKTLKSMESAINNGDAATLVGQCSQVIEWNSFGGDASMIESIQDIDADLDETLDGAKLYFSDVADGCEDVFDKGEATKAQKLGQDIMLAEQAFTQVKTGTYDKYLGLKK